jgi:hypothetical protein
MSDVGTPKVTGDQLTAAQHTPFLQQVEAIITDAGGSLVQTDIEQYRQGIASYAGVSTFYTDSGIVNNYVLTPQGNFRSPIDSPSNWNGLMVRFRPLNANTGASTVNLAGLNGGTPIEIVRENGDVLQDGDLSTDKDVMMRYDLALGKFFLVGSSILENITGVIGGFATNTPTLQYLSATSINYLSGYFTFDDLSGTGFIPSTGTVDFTINGLDGLDIGGVAPSTTYHIFCIFNPTTLAVGAIASISLSSPTLPAGFTKKRRIASLITDGSANIIQAQYFPQRDGGYYCYYNAPILDEDLGSSISQERTHTLTIPSDIETRAFLNVAIGTGGGVAYFYIYHPDLTELTPSDTVSPLASIREADFGNVVQLDCRIATLGFYDGNF